jgi:uncharacterized protein (TIGR04255 family)
MLERKQYRKPPLIEVFCEFFFEPFPDSDWDALLMADFYRGLGKHRFPKSKRAEARTVQLMSRDSQRGRQRHSGGQRHCFASADGNTTVQVGENLLVLNQLPPYYGWERFENDAKLVLALYLNIWPSTQLASVHYIDRIDIPDPTFHLEEYFALFPVLPDDLMTCPISNLAMAFEVCGDTEGDVLAVAFHQQPCANPGTNSFRLQWDYVATVPQFADVPSVVDWLRTAHSATSRAFRSSLTDRCEQLFEGGG